MRSRVLLVVVSVVCGLLVAPALALAEPSEHPFEIVPGSFAMTPSSTEAGAHANLTTAFDFAAVESGKAAGRTDDEARTTVVNLPVGFDGSDTAVPTCTTAQLVTANVENKELPSCPIASQVGQISFDLSVNPGAPARFTYPIYNMEVTSFGTTAEFAFKTAYFTTLLDVSVRPSDDGLTVTSPDIPTTGEVNDVVATIWGEPAASEHDAQRGEYCNGYQATGTNPDGCFNIYGGPQEAGIPVKALLSNPTSCGPFAASMQADSWEHPEEFSEAQAQVGPIGECERVPFDPSIEVQPTSTSVESPSGLNVSLLVPQTWENANAIATANLKDTTVTLPEGMTANPGLAAGLGACTPAQYASETYSSLPGEGCPPESKIGSIEIETPLLAEKIGGAIYIATPYDNPFSEEEGHPNGSLLALYVVAKDPERGIIIKVAGKITPNPVTGQLTTTFENTPQQPFSKFTLHFRPGATAPLITPSACGSYTVSAALTPWSAPGEPRYLSSQPFTITHGLHEGACPSGGGVGGIPFNPTVVSGTQNNAAGSFSPFYLRIERQDGEQEITKFSTTLPPGLTGDLTGIPFCPEADIEAARSVSGAEEEANPSCPAASEIGHTIVEAGVGSVLAQTPGKVYLAGPYHGAPLSIVSITSAKVGPFDLGTVVIRFALFINPITAQVEVSGAASEAIPRIIKGIVVHVRTIRVYMSREKFIINPTSCEPMSIQDAITGAGANPAEPAGQDTVPVSTRFQATDCASLAFKPSFNASTSAKHTRKDGASLKVKLAYPEASQGTQANIHVVKVELPKALPARLNTLQQACTAAQFEANPAGCPAASVVGHAKAVTPILPVPLEGPAYFVSYGAKWPQLIFALQGYGITIDLHGETFISKTGITSTTLHTVPDQPVSSFELTLPQGEHSALAANGNLCSKKLAMPTKFIAQNGKTFTQKTKIKVTGCAALRHRSKKRLKHKGKGAKHAHHKHTKHSTGAHTR